ncbi:phage major capsid protein, P2 family [Pseudoalteromonas ruthenica]|uniref:Phage major capsid protein, P2 family n=1 Tax=Pseudoalteromonas ruthenica TaxID=151081 RepID=A0A5S3Z8E3_9GAMM|nr:MULTISPECIES: phage major capsid protein, P2 family [Pseudoalteromonas]MCG7567079.1 phage major capsid protein, P2 family [Pseudoalteromonas sp. CnMc7-15]MCG7570542.1 phage major capsid protein, P2 family [Pseudoalteromonas sp. CNC9-20]TMP88524.1 phage major capsid protein, P2 family [Pseudoalteromonas ruthenica]|tara:strand:+ start:66221 stop:67261 length:1041 start_codon:yes stop_codon:yes gene_type:complete
MKLKTSQLFASLMAGLASNYGVASMSEQFSVEPSIEQSLYDMVYESVEFLQMINTATVDDLVGQSVFMGVGGGVTGRAGVEQDGNRERKTRDVAGLSKREYRCYPTECDVHLPWYKMDQWSKFPDFANRYRNHVKQAIALDIIKIGWHGTHAADVTDIVANPMMEDVNIGWLQLVRRDAPGRAISEGEKQAGEIRIGTGGDYENLDQAVHDLIQAIPEHKRVNLVAIVGGELHADDKNKLYAKQAHTPSEKSKIELQQVIDTYGGLPTYKIPFFPERGILVTTFENLSFYVQEGSTRTHIEDNPKKKRVEDYQSRNDCYYVEDLEMIAFFESANVKVTKDGGTTWS